MCAQFIEIDSDVSEERLVKIGSVVERQIGELMRHVVGEAVGRRLTSSFVLARKRRPM
jgi:hypothetical protein